MLLRSSAGNPASRVADFRRSFIQCQAQHGCAVQLGVIWRTHQRRASRADVLDKGGGRGGDNGLVLGYGMADAVMIPELVRRLALATEQAAMA